MSDDKRREELRAIEWLFMEFESYDEEVESVSHDILDALKDHIETQATTIDELAEQLRDAHNVLGGMLGPICSCCHPDDPYDPDCHVCGVDQVARHHESLRTWVAEQAAEIAVFKSVDSSVGAWDARRLVREICKMPRFRRVALAQELLNQAGYRRVPPRRTVRARDTTIAEQAAEIERLNDILEEWR